jgi:predicted Zn finger-like uncharacterized protein
MSLITRCPACGTMFKVVSDQLKVSQGWVRCGQCAEVFDALLYLQTGRASQVDLTSSPAVLDAKAVSVFATDTHPQSAGSYPGPSETTDSFNVPDASEALKAADILLAAEPMPEVSVPTPALRQESLDSPNVSFKETLADVSFVRDARREAFWRRSLVRVLLSFLVLLFASLLALQFAVQQRDRLALFEPRIKPALQILCEMLACSLGPVRQIEAIAIENSSFNKVNDSIYRLSFSVKNTALTAIAMPSLEVTLTDAQDQAVIRRVLAPAELGMVSGLLGTSAEFSGALTLQLTPLESSRDTGNISRRIVGYQLLAFYP